MKICYLCSIVTILNHDILCCVITRESRIVEKDYYEKHSKGIKVQVVTLRKNKTWRRFLTIILLKRKWSL